MEEKQELKDILINEEEGKAGGSKKMLLFAAAALLVFIFAIFVVYAINSGDEKEQQSVQQQQQNKPEVVEETVVEEVMPQEPKTIDGGDAPATFEQVPIEPEAAPGEQKSEKFDEIIKDIKDKNIPAPPAKAESASKKSEAKQPVKKEEPKAAKKEPSKPKTTTTSVGVPRAYYIQVGANVKTEPDQKFLKKITDAGYSYKLQHVNKNGNEIVRTLVGPYNGISAAKKDIAGVQKSINPKAFIFEVK